MDFELTPEQADLRSAVRDVLERECPPALVRAVVEEGASTQPLWTKLAELGWPALTVAEEHGGLGLGFVELVLAVEEMGRHLLPGPFLATVTQLLPAVQAAGPSAAAHRLLGAVARGELTGSLAVAESDRGSGRGTSAVARQAGDDWVLEGRKRWVLHGDEVDELVVAARIGDDAVGLFAVPQEAVNSSTPDALDPSRAHADVELDGVSVPGDRVLTLDGAAALRRALEEATVALAADLVGSCQQLFTMTLDYAKVREQFGVPIGSFQAVKHKLADMYVALERARSTVYFAAMTIAEDDPRRSLAASMAKAAAGDAARLIAQDGIQLHGGIAYTWEHDVHLYVKRLMAGGALLGTAQDHRREVAAALLDRPHPNRENVK